MNTPHPDTKGGALPGDMSEKKPAKIKCAGTVVQGWHSYPCSRNGKLEHGGKHYCGLHHPPTAQAKRQERDNAWDKKYEAERKTRLEAEAERLKEKRRAALYPELLEALRIADAFCGSLTSDVCPDSVHIPIRAAIAKATGATA